MQQLGFSAASKLICERIYRVVTFMAKMVAREFLPSNPALTQTCFAAEDAARFAKLGSG